MLYLGGGAREVCLIPFPVRRIILCLRPHPKLSRYGTAIEDSLEASSRRVLPALQAEVRYSDSQEMAGAMDVETRGAVEGSEGDSGSGACDGSAVGEVGLRRVYQPPYAPESCGAGICGGSAVGRRATVLAHRSEEGSRGGGAARVGG
jgi:hypothetical protein